MLSHPRNGDERVIWRSDKFMKEISPGIAISVAVHLCTLLLLMVPSLATQTGPHQVLLVDFSLSDDPLFKQASPTPRATKRVQNTHRIPENENTARRLVKPDRPIAEYPAAVSIQEDYISPATPTIPTRSDTPVQNDLDDAPSEKTDETSARLAESIQADSFETGAVASNAGSPEAVEATPHPSDRTIAATDRVQTEGPENVKAVGGSSEDYHYIRHEIMKRIRYPEKARRMGIDGRVLLSFAVLEDGTTSEIRVIQSSNHRLLDESAKEAVAGVRLTKQRPYRIVVRLPVTYRFQGVGERRI